MVAAGDQALLAELLRFAKELPPPILESVCRRLEALPSDAPADDRAQVAVAVSNPEMRHALAKVIRECAQASPGVSPERMAWFLRGASAMDGARREEETLQVVWTGPANEAIPTRRTDQVLLDLIESAKEELLVVSYAAYRIPELAASLKNAIARGVRVIMVLEGMEAGTLKFDALPAFGRDIVTQAEIYAWPLDRRPCDAKGNRGALHAKCAVADRTTLLVTSANLTEAAMDRNMELGLLVGGGEAAQRVWQCFDTLMREGVLVQSKPQ